MLDTKIVRCKSRSVIRKEAESASRSTARQRRLSVLDHLAVGPFTGYALGCDITISPIRIGQAGNTNAFTAGRIGEFAVAYIETDVGDSSSGRVKEYQIADTQVRLGYGRALFSLACGCAGQLNAEFLEDIPGESRAIET